MIYSKWRGQYPADFQQSKAGIYINVLPVKHTITQEDGEPYDEWEFYSHLTQERRPDELQALRAKLIKRITLDTITVTTSNGNTFDGDETARNNMLSAISSAELIGQDTHYWKMADNTVVEITLSELKEALALAIQAVANIVL